MFANRGFALQYAKFAVVGIISLMVDYGALIFLTENTVFGLDYFQASAFSYTISIFVNYILSMKYVFHGKEDMSRMKEASIFFVLSLIGLLLNQMVMWFTVECLGIYYAAAKMLSTLMVTNYNYLSRKKFLE
jgi:putative flippase GtrA